MTEVHKQGLSDYHKKRRNRYILGNLHEGRPIPEAGRPYASRQVDLIAAPQTILDSLRGLVVYQDPSSQPTIRDLIPQTIHDRLKITF